MVAERQAPVVAERQVACGSGQAPMVAERQIPVVAERQAPMVVELPLHLLRLRGAAPGRADCGLDGGLPPPATPLPDLPVSVGAIALGLSVPIRGSASRYLHRATRGHSPVTTQQHSPHHHASDA